MAMLDVMILLMLFFGLWRGFQLGLLRSLVSLFGWFFALIFATYFAKPLSIYFANMTTSATLAMVIAFIVVALVVIIGLQFILWIMSKTLQGLRLSFLDKLVGAIFGVGKNLLVVLLILSLITPLVQNTQAWKQSVIIPELLPFAPFALQMSKSMANQAMDKTTESLDELSKNVP